MPRIGNTVRIKRKLEVGETFYGAAFVSSEHPNGSLQREVAPDELFVIISGKETDYSQDFVLVALFDELEISTGALSVVDRETLNVKQSLSEGRNFEVVS